ncbi:universal stress protein [Streptomyces sp. P9(2023)]|uniref:universal stress protein n=1 Tax=Streptomyces sp. P9(2023) TaxID=3064394 RepID=UPI0028F449CA|nr:universal stress protein [Streptomyces sp. P9(2023)]MDT9686858.1 universal stress protein [Streptomyces sp. P9(2023)]
MDEKPVVVGVDGSEHSERALAWALAAAQQLGVPLVVAHVRSEALQLGEARISSLGESPNIPDTVLNGVAAWIEGQDTPRVPVRYESLDGTVPDALLDSARTARLLVTGSRGRGGFASLLLGSVSRSLASSAPCPVVVVPHEARTVTPEDGAEAGRVLVGLHPEETADEVLDFAFHAAEQRGVTLEVVTAYRLPPSPVMLVGPPAPALQVPPALPLDGDTPELVRDTVRLQDERLRPFTERYPDVTVAPTVVPADAAGRLVEGSRSADLVVVGRHRRHRVTSLLIGSVAHAVLHHAHCPVAVVPPAAAS